MCVCADLCARHLCNVLRQIVPLYVMCECTQPRQSLTIS